MLHVGDFGIWPDPTRIDGATKRHDGAGDFPAWWSERQAVPRRTLFIKGNHEDFVWLDDLVLDVRPQVCLFGYHHTRLDAAIDGVPCMGINKAPHPGSLVAMDIGNRRQGMQVIGEWPRKDEPRA